jgi:hypothetical protein
VSIGLENLRNCRMTRRNGEGVFVIYGFFLGGGGHFTPPSQYLHDPPLATANLQNFSYSFELVALKFILLTSSSGWFVCIANNI